MSNEFKKEDRYLVIKRSDIEKFLTCPEKEELYQLAGVVRDGRAILTSKSLECVVVESDWPIYNDVWKMVEAIAKGESTELEQLRKKLEACASSDLASQFMDTSVEIRTPIEYGVMIGAYMSLGAKIWPWHKGYKPLGEDEEYHTYAWQDCGILKLAGVAESSKGDYASALELVEAIHNARGGE
ncbi:hypothetical protein [Vibrio europaeus]|uniref:hypothetical protein n=1 Tax=Vibrio europaeus TaxID=300876 RepID=UPI00233EF512|nr:hypothetical protein [Vibrio europaeus]MDC5753555.1 hypothetical protein [Vibrio europaeus]MDC5816533.1 hypothetical protein [Vibrio europaeus]